MLLCAFGCIQVCSCAFRCNQVICESECDLRELSDLRVTKQFPGIHSREAMPLKAAKRWAWPKKVMDAEEEKNLL